MVPVDFSPGPGPGFWPGPGPWSRSIPDTKSSRKSGRVHARLRKLGLVSFAWIRPGIRHPRRNMRFFCLSFSGGLKSAPSAWKLKRFSVVQAGEGEWPKQRQFTDQTTREVIQPFWPSHKFSCLRKQYPSEISHPKVHFFCFAIAAKKLSDSSKTLTSEFWQKKRAQQFATHRTRHRRSAKAATNTKTTLPRREFSLAKAA